LDWISFEFLLTRCNWGNGGDVIVLRSFLCASLLVIAPCVAHKLGISAAKELADDALRLFGLTFAAFYLALSSRFASQWTYLAGVYNQIKAAECRGLAQDTGPQALAEWKAAFAEDALDLHLAYKPMFAMILHQWLGEKAVQEAFCSKGLRGRARLEKVRDRVTRILRQKGALPSEEEEQRRVKEALQASASNQSSTAVPLAAGPAAPVTAAATPSQQNGPAVSTPPLGR